jgi:glutaredoxin
MAKQATLYTQPGCRSCHRVETFLRAHGVVCTVKDVVADGNALAELTALGYLATPVTVIDSVVVAGFDRRKLERLLRR